MFVDMVIDRMTSDHSLLMRQIVQRISLTPYCRNLRKQQENDFINFDRPNQQPPVRRS